MRGVIISIFALVVVNNLSAQVLRFATIFCDNAVLQQKATVKIWGNSKPNSVISLCASWSPKPVEAFATSSGRWLVELETIAADHKAHQVVVRCEGDSVVLNDVVLGEVWLCSGQSNMEMPLRTDLQSNLRVEGSEKVFAQPENRDIRMITLTRSEEFEPISDLAPNGGWRVQNRDNAQWFSAVGYFFGAELLAHLKVPVGLIVSSYGGTAIQSWFAQSVTHGKEFYVKENSARIKELEVAALGVDAARERMSLWVNRAQGTSTQRMVDGLSSIDQWPTVKMPMQYNMTDLGEWLGGMVLSREVEVDSLGEVEVSLGMIDRLSQIYWEGHLVWERVLPSEAFTKPRFKVKSDYVNRGKAVITINLISYMWNGGILGTDDQMWYRTASGHEFTLCGDWHYKKSFNISEVEPLPNEGRADCFTINSLYNGMIHPIHDYTIKGVLWYQGEANVHQADDYPQMMADMVASWRKAWGVDFPFYYVQISPWRYSGVDNTEAAKMRAKMDSAVDLIQRSGVVVTVDLGDNDNIHPARKAEVGERLARWALRCDYGLERIEPMAPRVVKSARNGREVALSFDYCGGALFVQGGEPDFELSSDGVAFHCAIATIKNRKVTLSSDVVSDPQYVRYCWRNGAKGTLFGGSGLPVSSFNITLNQTK